MDLYFSTIASLAPIWLLAAALYAARVGANRTRSALMLGGLATGASVIAAVLGAASLVMGGPRTVELLVVEGIGVSMRIDAVSITMLALIAVVGAVLVRFCRGYLAGNPRQGRFVADLLLVLGSIGLVVLSGNLAGLVLGWVGSGLALQRLLAFDPRRPGARRAVVKHAAVAHASDLLLAVAALGLAAAASSADITTIGAAARSWVGAGSIPPSAQFATVMLVLAACLRSVQLPAHGWLIDVVEAPTPVSALLHAGIVNGGGFLVIRFSDVVVASTVGSVMLVLIGGLTAVIAGLILSTQSRVKHGLAFSTVAQMGFMLLQCGLGAFTAAMVHLVAHSFYKAHAFLGSGRVLETLPARREPARHGSTRPWSSFFAALALAIATVIAIGSAFGFDPAHEPAIFVLGGALALAMGLWIADLGRGRLRLTLVAPGVVAMAGMISAYFGLQSGAQSIFEGVVASGGGLPAAVAVAGALVLVGLVLVAAVQWRMPSLHGSPRADAAYVWAKNGFYLDAHLDRWARASVREDLATSPNRLRGATQA